MVVAVLRAVASDVKEMIATAAKMDYHGPFRQRISLLLNKPIKEVDNCLESLFNLEGTRNIFSWVLRGIDEGFVDLNASLNGNNASDMLDSLTPARYKAVRDLRAAARAEGSFNYRVCAGKISPRTLESHIASVYETVKPVSNRAQLAVFAYTLPELGDEYFCISAKDRFALMAIADFGCRGSEEKQLERVMGMRSAKKFLGRLQDSLCVSGLFSAVYSVLSDSIMSVDDFCPKGRILEIAGHLDSGEVSALKALGNSSRYGAVEAGCFLEKTGLSNSSQLAVLSYALRAFA